MLRKNNDYDDFYKASKIITPFLLSLFELEDQNWELYVDVYDLHLLFSCLKLVKNIKDSIKVHMSI